MPKLPWLPAPTGPGKYWVALAPKWRHIFGGWLFRAEVRADCSLRFGRDRRWMSSNCEGLQGALYLPREIADPFAKDGG